MKAVNAYYRKNKTLEGCPQLETVSIERLTASMETFDRQPYPAWALSNNNANIHRVRERIAVLEKEAERAAEGPAEIAGEGYTVRENSNIGRVQIVFDGKPSAEIRELLKANGFRWAPSEGAWQRLLNDHGRSAAEYVTNKIKDMEVF